MFDDVVRLEPWSGKHVDQDSMNALIALLPKLEALSANSEDKATHKSDSEVADELYQQFYDDGWVVVFDWSKWARGKEGQRIFRSEFGIEEATLSQVIKAITAIIRADRFQQHLYSNSVANGTFLRIVRRVEQLVREINPPT